MSYYILPKNINNIDIEPLTLCCQLGTYVSHNLYIYYEKSIKYLHKICDEEGILDINYLSDNLIKIVNPYEYIFSKVPGSNYSVSKLKPNTNLFYDILEIFSSLNVFENYSDINIKSTIISKNNSDIIDYLQLSRENHQDEYIIYNNIENVNNINIHLSDFDNNSNDNNINDKKNEFIFYEMEKILNHNTNDILNTISDIINLVKIIMFIIKYQKTNGITIIKMNSTLDKPTIDILYLLSSLFDKTLIIKPNTSNILTFEKYIVCKNFVNNSENNITINNIYLKLLDIVKTYDELNDKNVNIKYLIKENIPCYFVNKIDEVNIILGQQQLESIDNIINLLKNKNKEEKMELIKKTNIQKSINWCEKYKIPCNKFVEKTNIFLIKND